MAIITLLTDFGQKDHYVAAVKAVMLSQNPNAQIIDISHHIALNNVLEAAFVLKNVYKNFPKGTVHLIGVNENHRSNALAVQLDGHYFISRDTGIFSLLSNKMPTQIAVIPNEKISSFSSKNVFAKVAVLLSGSHSISDLGNPSSGILQLKYPEMHVAKDQIAGQIMHVDGYGNLVTNIEREAFETQHKQRSFEVSFEREYVKTIHNTYTDVDPGDVICFFNDNNLLEIAVHDGNASKLFGLEFGASVKIYFR